MNIVKIILAGIYVILAAALVIVVLLQESNDGGLSGTIAGSAETFFSQNKGRSPEEAKKKFTAYASGAFVVLSLVLGYLVLNV